MLPEEKRVTAVFEQNAMFCERAIGVYEHALGKADFLVGNRFSVTDIINGWALNWAFKLGYCDAAPRLQAYLTRLRERPCCPLKAK